VCVHEENLFSVRRDSGEVETNQHTKEQKRGKKEKKMKRKSTSKNFSSPAAGLSSPTFSSVRLDESKS